ncbi:outer dynein arm-docking complex subunit 4 isoform X2 [Alligator mississippiensis]|uniref:outer dynein arm-docking complex subunit 4 isoform X2 n=1 Tax=Alligator mississippiensis TaxID=8496 RepID=UPI002877420A|nr:outer dynein arm-docking complex subunit 4 isoform X2 [Alligator mississippiensis]
MLIKSEALQLQKGDKHCLVARSKCYLKLGDTENSLKDAEASLQNDKTFSKGLYQKAETLYTMGDFEFALVFYHRGHKLRPELQKFRLGIQKAQEAIDNCVGSPSSVKLENKGDLCFLSRQAESKKMKQKLPVNLARKDQKRLNKQEPIRNTKAERQLLGELYADKAYLEKLLKDEDLIRSNTKQGMTVEDLILGGIKYLDTRTEFWQQQKPIYARVRDRKLRQQRWIQDKKRKPSEVARHIVKSMEDIDMLLTSGCPEGSCKKAEHVLKTIKGRADVEVPNKNELIGNLYSCIGNAQIDMGQMGAALQSHKMDLEIAKENDLPDAISRALDNIGRVYARIGKFQEAIDTWEEKIPMAKTSLEKTWLFHEIGRCYLELNQATEGLEYGEKSLQSAEEEGDVEWQLNASVLVAQAQVKLEDYQSAVMNFEKALEKAKLVHNDAAQQAIIIALDDANKDFIEELKVEKERRDSFKDFGYVSEYFFEKIKSRHNMEQENDKQEEREQENERNEKEKENERNETEEEENERNEKEKERNEREEEEKERNEREKEKERNETEEEENERNETEEEENERNGQEKETDEKNGQECNEVERSGEERLESERNEREEGEEETVREEEEDIKEDLSEQQGDIS